MSRRKRTSLSDWWAQPDVTSPDARSGESDMELRREGDGAIGSPICKETGEIAQASPVSPKHSPAKRSNPSFYIGDGDDSDAQSCEGSPRKKAACRVSKGSIDPATISMMKGVCAEYFDNNVAPILRFVQQTQEIWVSRLKELTGIVDQKANAVATSAQLEKLAAAVKRKADVADVPDLAQPRELQKHILAAEKRVATLNEELCELRKIDCAGRSAECAEFAEIKNVKAVFAAAGLRVDRQLKEIRQQMQQLREECLLSGGLRKGGDDRWPGRQLRSSSHAPSLNSDNDSDRLSFGSATESLAASATLDPEEKAELKRIRAILAAAGNAYSKDLREVKNQMREMRTEVQELKVCFNEHHAGPKSTVGVIN